MDRTHVCRSKPRTCLTSTTGYGTLGDVLLAAIGAAVAKPGRRVAAIVVDSGLQFSLTEMITANEVGTQLLVRVWNNSGYGEVRECMTARNISLIGVHLSTPDHIGLARAYAWRAERITHLEQFTEALSRVQLTSASLRPMRESTAVTPIPETE